MLSPRRLSKYYYLRFLRLKGDPRAIARGVALGVFIGITPTIPFHTIALLLLIPICRANLVAAFLASVLMCNPLTYFPQYYFSWLLGNWLTPANLSWERIKTVMDIVFSDASFSNIFEALSHLGTDTAIVLVVGGCVLAAPFAVISYYVSLKFFTALQKKKSEKHILN